MVGTWIRSRNTDSKVADVLELNPGPWISLRRIKNQNK
jgi:hypothetical protein